MVKRLLFLGFLCAAMLFLMGLMVVNAKEGLPPPRYGHFETPFLAPAAPRADDKAAPRFALVNPRLDVFAFAPPPILPTTTSATLKPPLLARFEAFHLSDRAG